MVAGILIACGIIYGVGIWLGWTLRSDVKAKNKRNNEPVRCYNWKIDRRV